MFTNEPNREKNNKGDLRGIRIYGTVLERSWPSSRCSPGLPSSEACSHALLNGQDISISKYN